MSFIKKTLLISFLILLVSSCFKSKDTDYLVFEEPAEAIEVDSGVYAISSFIQVTDIDILFVVDNSGSMGSIQRNVSRNARLFMEQFALNNSINWKIGVVSTDDTQPPFLGFATPFGADLIDEDNPVTFNAAVDKFSSAISSLGTNGSASEYVFYNSIRHINEWSSGIPGKPTFLRENAHLIVIMITDEEEQSEGEFGSSYSVNSVIDNLSNRIPSDAVLRFYGAMGQGDLAQCSNSWRFGGDPMEDIIEQTGGFAISACIDDFGRELSRIGEDIATLVKVPRLVLSNRPVVNTIKITYNGEELRPGRPENGGVWYYDFSTNTINFYTIDFVEDTENDKFDITFDVSDGIDRD